MELRPYQIDCLDKVRSAYKQGKRAPLLVAPTGAGKTVMFSAVAAGRVARGGRPMILCHRQELVDQIVSALRQFGIEPGIVAAGYPMTPERPVQVASVWTLYRRLNLITPPDLIIVDEAHHATSKTTWGKILKHYNVLCLGVTATPYRLSGEGMNDVFDELVLGPSVQELIDIGALSQVKTYAPSVPDTSKVKTLGGDFNVEQLNDIMDKSTVTGDAVAHYKRLCDGQPAIAFCVSVEHARHVAEQFNAAGYRAASIDGGMEKDERRAIVKDFGNGQINVLTSCEIVSEGFDVPRVAAGILLRPTKSLALYMQQVGRCLRPFAGKAHAVILDHAGNSRRFGLVSEPQQWTLEGRERKSGRAGNREQDFGLRVCTKCFAASSGAGTVCGECGEPFPVRERTVAKRDGELSEVRPGERRERRIEQSTAESIEQLIAIGKLRGYANPAGWAWHIFQARQKKRGSWSKKK